MILAVFIFAWGLPQTKDFLNRAAQTRHAVVNHLAHPTIEIPNLHLRVQRVAPVVPAGAAPEKAVLDLNWLAVPGTAILLASLLASAFMRLPVRDTAATYFQTLHQIRF